MANKHVTRCSTSKNPTNNKCWQGCRKKGSFSHCWGNVNWCSHCGEQYGGSSKTITNRATVRASRPTPGRVFGAPYLPQVKRPELSPQSHYHELRDWDLKVSVILPKFADFLKTASLPGVSCCFSHPGCWVPCMRGSRWSDRRALLCSELLVLLFPFHAPGDRGLG